MITALCALALAVEGPAIALECDRDALEFARPFELRIARSWDEGWIPRRFDPAELAPLTVLSQHADEQRGEGRIHEVLTLQSAALTLEDVELPAADFEVHRGAESLRATRPARTWIVVPHLDPERPGDPEAPPLLPVPGEEGGGSAALVIGGLLVLGLLALALSRRRGPEPADTPADHARRQLRRVRARDLSAAEARRIATVQAAEIVREFLDRGLHVPAPRRTTRQVRGLLPREEMEPECERAIVDGLTLADAVKFGAAAPTEAECRRSLEELADALEEPA